MFWTRGVASCQLSLGAEVTQQFILNTTLAPCPFFHSSATATESNHGQSRQPVAERFDRNFPRSFKRPTPFIEQSRREREEKKGQQLSAYSTRLAKASYPARSEPYTSRSPRHESIHRADAPVADADSQLRSTTTPGRTGGLSAGTIKTSREHVKGR